MLHENVMLWQHVSPIRSSPKEKILPHIGGIHIVGGNSDSSPWLVLTIRLTKHGQCTYGRAQYTYMTYITTYPSSGAHAFNTARTTLYTLRERIHVLQKWPQDITRSTRPRCIVVTSHMTDTQPLLSDRDCPQASLVLRGWVRDSHHPVGGYLTSYLFVGVSLQNSKLHKLNVESKSQFACHLLRLL
jgi:hypothetical protein